MATNTTPIYTHSAMGDRRIDQGIHGVRCVATGAGISNRRDALSKPVRILEKYKDYV